MLNDQSLIWQLSSRVSELENTLITVKNELNQTTENYNALRYKLIENTIDIEKKDKFIASLNETSRNLSMQLQEQVAKCQLLERQLALSSKSNYNATNAELKENKSPQTSSSPFTNERIDTLGECVYFFTCLIYTSFTIYNYRLEKKLNAALSSNARLRNFILQSSQYSHNSPGSSSSSLQTRLAAVLAESQGWSAQGLHIPHIRDHITGTDKRNTLDNSDNNIELAKVLNRLLDTSSLLETSNHKDGDKT